MSPTRLAADDGRGERESEYDGQHRKNLVGLFGAQHIVGVLVDLDRLFCLLKGLVHLFHVILHVLVIRGQILD